MLVTAYGQETKKIDIRQAASFEVNEKSFPDAKILKSNKGIRVHLHHDGMDIWSDIAYFYETRNFFEAQGNVIVKQGDSLQLNSEFKQIHKKASIVLQRNAVPMDRLLALVFLLPAILLRMNKAWNLPLTLDGQISI